MDRSRWDGPGPHSRPLLLDPADPMAQPDVRAWLALVHAFPLRAAAARAALGACDGDPLAASRHGREAAGDAALRAAVDALKRAAARLVPIDSPLYPARLGALPDAPPLLFVQGDCEALAAPSVAVVGARAPTAYGLAVARALAGALAHAGLCVVSGLARGIDGAAHAAALAAGGRTVAVQGCGSDRVYPSSHRGLAARIVAQGAVVSELPPGTPPLPHHFPLRNRLISGLARAVVVVEAREKSGSLGTALHAAEQDREVFAVPGPIDAPTSAGANRLLQDGAHPYLAPSDVLLRLGVTPPPEERAAPLAGGLGAEARAVLAQLAREPATRDGLALRMRRPIARLEAALLELELAGALDEDRAGRLRVSPRARAGAGAPPGERPL